MDSKKLTIAELRELVNTEKIESFDIAISNGSFFWAVEPFEDSYRLIPLSRDGMEEHDPKIEGKVHKNGTLDVPFQRTDFYEAVQNLEVKRGSAND